MKPTLLDVDKKLKFLNLVPTAVAEVFKVVEESYAAGFDDSLNERLEDLEIPENYVESVGVNYAIEAFADVKSYSDFKEKQLELERLQLNHTKPIPGQYLLFNQSKS